MHRLTSKRKKGAVYTTETQRHRDNLGLLWVLVTFKKDVEDLMSDKWVMLVHHVG